MELFKLFGTIAVNNNEANNAIDETTGKAESGSNKMSGAFKKVAAAVGTYLSVKAVVGFGKSCVDAASNVEEMENKFNVVFGDLSKDTDKWAGDFASAIGRNKTNIKSYLADNQNMFVGMGMTREEGAKMSKQLVALGLDLASFNNLSEDDAVNALSKAIMGETESAKQLGAVLNDNTRIMAMEKLGYKGKFDALTEAQKMEVNYQAILMQSTDAVGDCERSMGSYKSTVIEMQSAMQTLKEKIGTHLLPVMTKLVAVGVDLERGIAEKIDPAFETMENGVQSAVDLFEKFHSWCQKNQTAVALLATGVGTLTAAVVAYNVAAAIKNAGGIVEIAQLGILQVQIWALTAAEVASTAATTALGAAVAFLTSPITLTIAAIGALIAIGVLLYKNWDKVKEKAGNLAKNLGEKWNNVKQKTKETFENVKTTISNSMKNASNNAKNRLNDMKNAYNSHGGGIKGIVAAYMTGVKGLYQTGFNVINTLTGGKLGEVVSKFQTKMNSAKTVVNEKLSSIKGYFSSHLSGAASTVSSVFGKIYSSVHSKMNSAASFVSSAISKIKGAFNFSWHLPHLSLPHISVSGGKAPFGIGGKGSLPHFSIAWYKKAMEEPVMFSKPTIFDVNPLTGQAKGAGEAGNEMMYGHDNLMKDIRQASSEGNSGIVETMVNLFNKLYEMLDKYFPEFANMTVVLDDGTVVGRLAPALDVELKKIKDRKGRGR